MTSNQSKNIIVVIVILLLIGGAYLVWMEYLKQAEPIVCTQEAKLCPDGSYVGRTGPKCEFAVCPEIPNGWKVFTDTKTGISFQYPEELSTQYITKVDWPSVISVISQPFSCTEAGSEVLPAGKTAQQVIDGRTYCVTRESEGAAGSTYTSYTYATSINPNNSSQAGNETIIFTFSFRFVQCANYDDPQKTVCENERIAFNVDNLIGQIVKTLK